MFAHGTPGQCQAITETHVAAIKIDGDHLTPIFKVPTSNDNGPAEASADPGVRTNGARLRDHVPVLYAGNRGLVAHECILDLRQLVQRPALDNQAR